MAITVYWDDGSEATWDEATEWTRDAGSARSPFLIKKDAKTLAEIPDFGVRYIGAKPGTQSS